MPSAAGIGWRTESNRRVGPVYWNRVRVNETCVGVGADRVLEE